MLQVLKYNGLVIAKSVEFAKSPLKQMLGLMFRKCISPDYSMIFVLKKKSHVAIHMLFVFFPIDVIFLDDEKNVKGFFRLKPWSGFKAMNDIMYVIEMNAGTIERFNITIGGQMDFEQ